MKVSVIKRRPLELCSPVAYCEHKGYAWPAKGSSLKPRKPQRGALKLCVDKRGTLELRTFE